MTSLPVPVSPVIMTVVFVGATASTWLRIGRRLPRRPTIVSVKVDDERSGLPSCSGQCKIAAAFIVFAGQLMASEPCCATEIMSLLPFYPYLDSSLRCSECRRNRCGKWHVVAARTRLLVPQKDQSFSTRMTIDQQQVAVLHLRRG